MFGGLRYAAFRSTLVILEDKNTCSCLFRARNEVGSKFPAGQKLGNLCDDGGLLPSEILGQLAKLEGNLDQSLESILGIPHQLLLVRLRLKVPFNVHPDGSTLASGAGQPPDDTGPVFESDDLSLVLADASIDRVSVVEVVGFRDLETGTGGFGLELGTDESTIVNCLLELVDELLGGGRLNFLVVVPGKEGATVYLIVPQEEVIDADEFVWRFLVSSSKDVKPC